jgi:fructokinase
LAGLELGGTTVRCAVADHRLTIAHATTFPTSTLATAARYFNSLSPRGFTALGVSSFGPLDVNARSNDYGQIAATPKTAWQGVNVVTTLAEATRTPRAVCETDVNAAALAEYARGAARGVDSCAYITVGTGIGAGYISYGSVLGWGGTRSSATFISPGTRRISVEPINSHPISKLPG